VVWQRRYQQAEGGVFANLEKTSDGGCVAVGRWAAPVQVWKLDADGSVQWAKRYSWPHVLSIEGDIKQTRDGGYIVTPGSSAGLGLFKLSSDGRVEWGKRVTGPLTGGSTAVVESADGSLLLLGVASLDGRSPSVLLKFSSSGDLLWQRRYDGGQSPGGHFNDIAPTPDGGVLAVGEIFHGFNSWNYKAWVVKLRSDGTVEWQREYANSSNQNVPPGGKFNGVTQCRDGTLIIGGSSGGTYQMQDIWIVRLSREGTAINARSYDCLPSEENGGRLHETHDGGFIASARFTSWFEQTHSALKLAGDLSVSGSCPGTIGRVTVVDAQDTAALSAETFLTPIDLIPASSDIAPNFANTTETEETICENAVRAPSISQHPTSQFALAGAAANFGVQAKGTQPLNFQWRKKGVSMAGATAPTVNLNPVGAEDSSDYSVVVWNAYGSVASDSAYLAVLTDGANGNQPVRLSTPPTPVKPPGVENLAVVVHGYEPFAWLNDVSWVDTMADKIREKVSADWLVEPYTWQGTAWGTPDSALSVAEFHGNKYGRIASQQHWSHVHLIGHSAGSAFVDAAARRIKNGSPATVIHCTFLDPYLTPLWAAGHSYGTSATWADSYIAHDWTGGSTERVLANAYNVDVTWADPDRNIELRYCATAASPDSTPLANLPCGEQAVSSHDWPHKFYLQTILHTALACANGYGFALSKEGGGLGSSQNQPLGSQPVDLCAPVLPPKVQTPLSLRLNPSVRIEVMPLWSSVNGVRTLDYSFLLDTPPMQPNRQNAQPMEMDVSTGTSWIAFAMQVTNPVNFVTFECIITNVGSSGGLLTVYWNTNEIGMIDTQVAWPGRETYRFALPETIMVGLYSLSFRLDSFDSDSVSATVTNLATGFVGLTNTIRLDAMLVGTNQTRFIRVTGAPYADYLLESSTNLLHWAPSAYLRTTNDTAFFAIPGLPESHPNFYRLVIQ